MFVGLSYSLLTKEEVARIVAEDKQKRLLFKKKILTFVLFYLWAVSLISSPEIKDSLTQLNEHTIAKVNRVTRIPHGGSNKFSAGSKAKGQVKYDLRKSQSNSFIIPGTSALVPHNIYSTYHQPTKLSSSSEKSANEHPSSSNKGRFNPARPVDSSKQSQPQIVRPTSQLKNTIITNKAVIKSLTEKEITESYGNIALAREKLKSEIADRVRMPDKVYKKIYRNKMSTIIEKNDRITIIDETNGVLQLDTEITNSEREQLANSELTTFELTDLRRDPQTGCMNEKGVSEAKAMRKWGELKKNEYRRPRIFDNEPNVDFLSIDGSQKFEVKSIVSRKNNNFFQSTDNVIDKIKSNEIKLQDNRPLNDNLREHPHYLIDMQEVHPSFQLDVHKRINKALNEFDFKNTLTIDYIF